MSGPLQRAGRIVPAIGAVLFAIPLSSLLTLPSASWIAIALTLMLVVLSVARPAAGLLALVIVLPLAFALTPLAVAALTVAQIAECLVLAFVTGAAAHAAFDDAFLSNARLRWPVFAFALLIIASGVCVMLAQADSFTAAFSSLWRSLATYFAGGGSAETTQPSMRWLELATLSLFVEAALRRRPQWHSAMMIGWLAAGAVAAGQTALRLAEVAFSRGGGVRGAVDLLRGTRLSPVFPDLNAAGSLFALLAVTAVVYGALSRHRLATVIVGPFLGLALLGTQSRAALSAAACVLGFLALRALLRSRHQILAAGLAALILLGGAGVYVGSRPTHVGIDAAVNSRVELAKVALKIARQAPAFGIGPGRFQKASRDFLEPGFVAMFPEAAAGENAHNNFLQILAELGLAGLFVFAWLVWCALGSDAPHPPAAAAHAALVAGLMAFLISALVGHPLLIYEVAAAAFVALGLAAGTSEGTELSVRSRGSLVFAVVAGLVVVSLPWRVSAALAPAAPEAVGVSPVQGELDGQPYRVAEATSRWHVRAHARNVVAPMRWRAPAATDCSVQIRVDDRLVDVVTLTTDAWQPVRFAIPPGRLPSEPSEVELRTAPGCQLLVGTLTATR